MRISSCHEALSRQGLGPLLQMNEGRSYNHCSEQRLLVTVDDRSVR